MLHNGDLASASENNSIKIWNLEDRTVRKTLTLTDHKGYVSALRVLENGDLISGSCDGAIIAWDTETGTVKKMKSTDSEVFSLEELDTGDMISVSHKSIIIWD